MWVNFRLLKHLKFISTSIEISIKLILPLMQSDDMNIDTSSPVLKQNSCTRANASSNFSLKKIAVIFQSFSMASVIGPTKAFKKLGLFFAVIWSIYFTVLLASDLVNEHVRPKSEWRMQQFSRRSELNNRDNFRCGPWWLVIIFGIPI